MVGQHKREINAILLALENGIPSELQKGGQVSVTMTISPLARKLHDDIGLVEDVARWAVEAWALADLANARSTPAQVSVNPPVVVTPAIVSSAPAPSVRSNVSITIASYQVATVNNKGQIIKTEAKSNKSFVEDLGNGVTLEMMQIPAGVFTMGSPATEANRQESEGPQHQVNVPAFWMGMTTVTQAQYEALIGTNPARFQGSNRPVENVSWQDAVTFCQKLSQKTSRSYRLPSEAEWEYACRAGTTTPFHFGSIF